MRPQTKSQSALALLAGAVFLERLLAGIEYPLNSSQLPLSLSLLVGYSSLWIVAISLHHTERKRLQTMSNAERGWFTLLTLALLFVSARVHSAGPAQFALSLCSLLSVICAALTDSNCGKGGGKGGSTR